MSNEPLEEIILQENKINNKSSLISKTAVVDIGGNITYSLIVGSILDYVAGLNLSGIIISRTYATGMNIITGGPYGWWREQAYKRTQTHEKSGTVRKTLVDLLAFNTFQVPIYATAIAVGSLISEGKVDLEKVKDGSIYLVMISPILGSTMGWYMDNFRKLCGVKSAAEGTYNQNNN